MNYPAALIKPAIGTSLNDGTFFVPEDDAVTDVTVGLLRALLSGTFSISSTDTRSDANDTTDNGSGLLTSGSSLIPLLLTNG